MAEDNPSQQYINFTYKNVHIGKLMSKTVQILADQLNFPESPLVDRYGNIWCTELLAGNLVRVHPDGPIRFNVGVTANGMIEDRSGNFFVTDSQNNAVRYFNPKTQKTTEIFGSFSNGQPIYRPNDLCFDQYGNLLVSCHAEARTTPDGYLLVQTSDGHVQKVSEGKFFPNGLAFDAEGTTLFFSETYRHRVWKAYWNAEAAKIEQEAPWVTVGGPIGPDGMCLDTEGNVYVTVFDQSRIEIISPEGTIIETIHLAYKRPTSCAFDPLGRYGLLVTDAEQGVLLSVDIPAKGLSLFKRIQLLTYETQQ